MVKRVYNRNHSANKLIKFYQHFSSCHSPSYTQCKPEGFILTIFPKAPSQHQLSFLQRVIQSCFLLGKNLGSAFYLKYIDQSPFSQASSYKDAHTSCSKTIRLHILWEMLLPATTQGQGRQTSQPLFMAPHFLVYEIPSSALSLSSG